MINHVFQSTRRHFGFSLIELTVVIGIIVVLVGFAVGSYVWAPEEARRIKMKQEMGEFHQAALRYYAKFSAWPRELTDLEGQGVVRIPPDPWGGEYTLENAYYITCRPPSGDVYQVPLCPKILFNFILRGTLTMVPVDPADTDEKSIQLKGEPFEIKARYKEVPIGEKAIEYRMPASVREPTINDLKVITHDPPDLILYGRPVTAMYDPKIPPPRSRVIYYDLGERKILDREVEKYVVATSYKFSVCLSKILRTYYYHFGETDGDVDMDGKAEVKITYVGDTMIVYDLDEDVGGIEFGDLDRLTDIAAWAGGTYYYLSDIMVFWNPDYHCRWSLY